MVNLIYFATRYPIKTLVFSFILLVTFQMSFVNAEAVSITAANFDTVISQHGLVFLNFYANWCRFSNLLDPIFDEVADKISQLFPTPGTVLLAKIDCDEEEELAMKYRVSKYPTLKVIRHGKEMKKEYRGKRATEDLIAHVTDLLKDPVQELKGPSYTDSVKKEERTILGYFDSKNTNEYEVFERVAHIFRDDCSFYALLSTSRPSGTILFKPENAVLEENDIIYTGEINYENLHQWASTQCFPLVKEITFLNAEELTEEGLPFLILFHHPDDRNSVELYRKQVQLELEEERAIMSFLTANGLKFSHPLQHLGKTEKDLPVIAIDSFRHMYLFPNFNDIMVIGNLKRFVQDLFSGKLHREFHFRTEFTGSAATPVPESTFKNLGPSKGRYTLLRDEL